MTQHGIIHISKSIRNAFFWFSLGVLSTIILLRQYNSFMTIRYNSNQFTMDNIFTIDTTSTTTSRKVVSSPNQNPTTTDDTIRISTKTPGTAFKDENINVQQKQQKRTPNERRVRYQYHPPKDRIELQHDNHSNTTNVINCGTYENNYDLFWKLDSKQRSRYDEDKIIYELFFRSLYDNTIANNDHDKNYHYVELGAFDGNTESNTRFFDVCLGWTGLLIEPNPTIYPSLIKNRPNAHRMSYAASCNETDENNNKTVTFYASWFTNAVEDQSPNRDAYASSKTVPKYNVPCGSLYPVLLDIFPRKHIHFLSIDTEGMEYNILQNIDFNHIQIDIILSENWNTFCQSTCPHREQVRNLLLQNNQYVLYSNTIRSSDLFIHTKSQFIHNFINNITII